jgi:CxxC motif-containing protein
MTIGITKCGGLLHYASNRLKNNYDIVKEAVKNSWFNLRYASEELKNNKEIVTIAVAQDGCALEYASNNLKNDKKIVTIAVAQDGCALEYASEELKNNKEFMLELLKINWDVILIIANHYFEDELREEYGCDSQKYGCNYYS